MRPTIMTFRCSTRHWPLIVPRFESEHSRPLVTPAPHPARFACDDAASGQTKGKAGESGGIAGDSGNYLKAMVVLSHPFVYAALG